MDQQSGGGDDDIKEVIEEYEGNEEHEDKYKAIELISIDSIYFNSLKFNTILTKIPNQKIESIYIFIDKTEINKYKFKYELLIKNINFMFFNTK